jgi:hypothetical protein
MDVLTFWRKRFQSLSFEADELSDICDHRILTLWTSPYPPAPRLSNQTTLTSLSRSVQWFSIISSRVQSAFDLSNCSYESKCFCVMSQNVINSSRRLETSESLALESCIKQACMYVGRRYVGTGGVPLIR